MARKPIIAVTLGAFWPGHESTGPNLSQMALCKALADEFDFRILARDRPFGASAPMVDNDRWHDLDYAKAHYLTVGPLGATSLPAVLRTASPDLLVINSFFDREFSTGALFWRRFGGGRRVPTLVSPRGEFSSGALGLKAGGKRLYRAGVAALGLMHGVHLHATSVAEQADLQRAFPGLPVTLVSNFRPLFDLPPHTPRAPGTPLRLAFVGRISPVKGLDFALDILARLPFAVDYTIYGPPSDAAYWAACQRKIAALPPHIRVTHRGEIANDQVAAELAGKDGLFLPSKSENFGHAMFEALAAGTPLIIGDQTPWLHLEKAKAGFDLPLDQPQAFIDSLTRLDAMTDPTDWRLGARAVAEAHVGSSEAPAQMRALFRPLLSPASS